jgi:hypothetical protein
LVTFILKFFLKDICRIINIIYVNNRFLVIGPLLQSNDQVQDALALYSEFSNSKEDGVNDVVSGIKNIKLQKQKEIDDDISGLGLNKRKNQAEEASKVFKFNRKNIVINLVNT